MRFTGSEMKVLDKLELSEISTKTFNGIVKTLNLTKPLFVIDKKDDAIEKSARNIPYVKVLKVEGINVYDVIRHEQLILTLDALTADRRGARIMNEYDVVVRPIITEKSSLLKETANQYVFEVQRDAKQDRDKEGCRKALQS